MNILAVEKEHQSAVEYYRAGPLAAMRRYFGFRVDFVPARQIREANLSSYDLFFCHRPVTKAELNAILVAKEHGLKIVLDYDDLIWRIPVCNPAILSYTPDAQNTTQEAVGLADLITVSTPGLAEQIRLEFGQESTVIRNAWNERGRYAKEWNEPQPDKPIKVLWRGSNTHDGDLMTHKEAFKPNARIDFHFFGSLPWYLLQAYGGHLPHFGFTSPAPSFAEYMTTLRTLRPSFVVVPLEDSEFNHCKSGIAAMEAIQCGAIPMVPGYMEEFDLFPALRYTHGKLGGVFEEALELIDPTHLFNRCRDSLSDNTLYQACLKRKAAFEGLL